jgi:multimeric flavodoxin WrbA
MHAMLSTIALLSSSRRHGNTGALVDQVAAQLGIEVVDLARLRITAFDYEHRNRGDDFEPLLQRVLAHEQVIFATPIYWYAVSPAMKVFLDRLSDLLELPDLLPDGRRLRGKNAYVLCTSAGEEPDPAFTAAFCKTFAYLGMHFGRVAHASCVDGFQPSVLARVAAGFAAQVRSAARAPSAA